MAEQLVTRVNLLPAVLGDRIAYRRAIAAGECPLTYRPRDSAAASESWSLFEAVVARTSLASRHLRAPIEPAKPKRIVRKAA